ncbi:putative holin [Carnimonas bestiolae]|uniref:putative holin n=1 Tax=Carnimonas bestiolae TaxID=3402172 RepID=UPI003EDBB8AB
MTEPSTTAATGAASVSALIISLLPGIDTNAMVGAFCGATLFVVSAKNLSLFERLTYLLISFLIGYMGGPALLKSVLGNTAVSAFVASAVTITIGLRVIELAKTIDLGRWFGGGK